MKARILLVAALALVGLWLWDPAGALAAESEGGGDKWGMWLTIGRFFNLAVLIGVLIWVGRKPLQSFYANRTATIQRQLREAQEARRQAEARLAEIEGRMRHLDDEVAALRAVAAEQAEQEYVRLLEAAQHDAEKIVERARREIDGLTRAAQVELRTQAAELAVRLAEERIRTEINDDDRKRLFQRFVATLQSGPR